MQGAWLCRAVHSERAPYPPREHGPQSGAPAQCPIDGNRTFASPENLRQHLDSSLHKNVRPFKCGECALDFTAGSPGQARGVCALEQRSFQCTVKAVPRHSPSLEHLATHEVRTQGRRQAEPQEERGRVKAF
jgi:hypothetical protein